MPAKKQAVILSINVKDDLCIIRFNHDLKIEDKLKIQAIFKHLNYHFNKDLLQSCKIWACLFDNNLEDYTKSYKTDIHHFIHELNVICKQLNIPLSEVKDAHNQLLQEQYEAHQMDTELFRRSYSK